MGKHAYLILAHSQFELLSLLVQSLDDVRNDIYIHLDKKVGERPSLSTYWARLFWVDDPVDVRWGDVSVVEAELKLFASAHRGGSYTYYHLLSGVDLPLKSQDYIHEFFDKHQGKEFVGFSQEAGLAESIIRKVQRRHLFADSFRETSGLKGMCKRIVRAVYIRLQELGSIKRNEGVRFAKGTQWVSVTDACVQGLLAYFDKEGLGMYQDTFCSDEIFLQTYLINSPLAGNIYDLEDEARGCLRHIGWAENKLADFTEQDLPALRRSQALFARKFNEKDKALLRAVLELSNQTEKYS